MKTYVLKYEDYDVVLKPTLNLKKVYLEITGICNYECAFCFRNFFEDPLSHMPVEVFYKVLENLKRLPYLECIVLGGIGEPLCHPEFLRFLKEVKTLGKPVIITTNGSLLKKEVLECLDSRDKLIVSFEKGRMGHFNKSRGFTDFVKGLTQSFSSQLAIQWILTKENVKELEGVLTELYNSGVKEVILSNLLPTSKELESQALWKEPEVFALQLEALWKRFRSKLRLQIPTLHPLTERHCQFVETKSLVVRWDGEVAPCYRFLHTGRECILGGVKKVKAFSFGNILKNSLEEVWTSFNYSAFRYRVKNALFPSCWDCKFREGCQFLEDTLLDCWGNSPSCADCLWWRGVLTCP